MGTNLINSIQHRNGPNQRPPNSIFGNSGSNQKLISNHLMYGFLGSVFCGVALITYLTHSLKHEKPIYGMGILAVLSIAVFIIIILVACIFLICQKRKKQLVVVCIEPSFPEFESDNLVFTDATHVDLFENPPPYDYAVKMPSSNQKALQSLPPSYDNINMGALDSQRKLLVYQAAYDAAFYVSSINKKKMSFRSKNSTCLCGNGDKNMKIVLQYHEMNVYSCRNVRRWQA